MIRKSLFILLLWLGGSPGLGASPPHTSMYEIFQGDGDEGIVCYKQKHRNFFFITFGLVVGLGLLTLNRYKIKKRSANELQHKNKIIEEKNKDIVDSINYAQRIQQAILPAQADILRMLPDSYIYFKPKDIVSGDFYWIAQKGDTLVAAIADCTGHGVPGAFMSMIGNAFLNEIVLERNTLSPASILNQLREKIIASLKQGENSESKDGMDIVLVALEKKNGVTHLKFAGANNPLWLIRGGNLTEIKGNKQPIGVSAGEIQPFTEHSFTLDTGDQICLFTDGFADQFGGKDGKKFRYKRLQELMVAIHKEPMTKQKEILAETMDSWKSGLEQVDDILVMGIKI